jgi:hypothetical protein
MAVDEDPGLILLPRKLCLPMLTAGNVVGDKLLAGRREYGIDGGGIERAGRGRGYMSLRIVERTFPEVAKSFQVEGNPT